MADALTQVARESGKERMVFSLCEWGRVSVHELFYLHLRLGSGGEAKGKSRQEEDQ